MMWGEHLRRRHWEFQIPTNDNNYCYLNTTGQCVKENNSYVHSLVENKIYNDHLEVNILETKKQDYLINDNKSENSILEHISKLNATLAVSKTVSTSPCNTLYVSPPYFTVDKFGNMDHLNNRDNIQIDQQTKYHTNKKDVSNINVPQTIPENRERFLLNNNNFIGIKVIENSHIPLVHFETSAIPLRLNVSKHYNQNPIVTEIYNYEKDLVSFESEAFQKRKKTYSHNNYMQDLNMKNDCIRNKLVSIHQYTGEKNLYRVTDLNAKIENSRIRPNKIQDIELKKSCSIKSRPTSEVNVTREKRKPNYRELINNANALRSSISENDLNMQIIKKTFNYKPLPTCNFSSSNIAIQSFKRNNDNLFLKNEKKNIFDKTHTKNVWIQHQVESINQNVVSPLDLSLKTHKTQPGPEQNKYGALTIEKGCPPKYNFEPIFLKKQHVMNNMEPTSPNNLPVNQRSVIRMNTKESILFDCSKISESVSNNKTPALDYSLGHNVCSETNPEVKESIISYGVSNLSGIEREVNRRRTYSRDTFDENKYLKKNKYINCTLDSSDNEYSLSSNIEQDKQTKKDYTQTCCSLLDNDNKKMEVNINHNDIVTFFDPPKIELLANPIEIKQEDVSSTIASRIRTKAELKGFVFQDECAYLQSKTPDLKSALDLCDWKSTCDSFANQLDQCYDTNLQNTFEKLQYSTQNIRTYNTNNTLNVIPVQLDVQFKKENLNENTEPNITNAVPVIFDTAKSITLSDENISKNIRKKGAINKHILSDEKVSNDRQKECAINKHTFSEERVLKDIHKECAINKNTIQKDEKVLKDVHKECAINKHHISPDFSSKNNKNRTRIVDLTKLSVVRLKREKCVSRILTQSKEVKLNNIETINDNISNDVPKSKYINVTLSNPSNKTKLVSRNTETPHSFSSSKNKSFKKVSKKNESNLSSIKTRLRTQVLEVQKEPAFKNKKNKFDLKRRFENKKESDLINNADKIYLEVYRYKRALKIPPNLITFKNKRVHRISKSLTNPDYNEKQNPHTNKDSKDCFDFNSDSTPKSIIDVLHSRVLKSRHHNKITQRYLKIERQHPSTTQQFNSKSNVEELKVNEKNNTCLQENRNVFETHVIPSRTRMQHKMKLNNEIIREVFRGNERPSSAPPQINTVEDSYEQSYNEKCMKYFENLNLLMENKNYFHNCKHLNSNKPKSVNDSKETEQRIKVNEYNKLNKSKQKRKRRIYKRRHSSGFDYLRKKKKTNKCAFHNYPRLKNKRRMSEDCYPFKNESDILKEIRKWVLNKGVGQSILHKAATLGYIDVIVYCLEKMGLHPDHKDNAGYTPLHDACVNGNLDIARVLLQYGANHSETAHSGIRPIHEASENGHIEIVRMLLSYGADPLLETYSGQTPLMLASDSEVNTLISMHLNDVKFGEIHRHSWRLPGPWNLNDVHQDGCNVFNNTSSLEFLNNVEENAKRKNNFRRGFRFLQDEECKADERGLVPICNQTPCIKNIYCDFNFLCDAANAEGELFEFEEACSPLPPLYLLKDEGIEKWVLLNDLCSLLKVKSKETLLHKIFPSVSPVNISRSFLKELKMCEFLERATCLQLLCAGEKINICHSKVVLIKYNENIRNLLGVKTIIMKL